jgi:hypothetical protein
MYTSAYETVYTITDWYDGARAGVADCGGKPHFYQCKHDYGPDEEYVLSPLSDELFQLALEDWAIWLRWEDAFDAGQTSIETHPALPEDETGHAEISDLLTKGLCINPHSAINASATFIHGQTTFVKWNIHQ